MDAIAGVNRGCKCHRGERGNCECLGCVRGHKLANVIRSVLTFLVHNANLNTSEWASILDYVDVDQNAQVLDPVLREVLLTQKYDLITLFSARGLHAMHTFKNCTSAPIYIFSTERAYKMKPRINYLKTVQSIFDGNNLRMMNGMSGLKETDFVMNSAYHDYFNWEDTNILLNAAICENPDFAHFLLQHSNPFVKTSQGWTPLHSAAECANELISKRLIMQGMDPNAVGRRYIKTSEDLHPNGTLTNRRISSKFYDHAWWDSTSPMEIASMTKKPHEKFLQDCRKQYLDTTNSIQREEEGEAIESDVEHVTDQNEETATQV